MMFLNTLDVSNGCVQRWKKSQIQNNVTPNNSKKQVALSPISERKKQLNEFLDLLPKMESHYCRKESTKQFIEPLWDSKTALYAFYCDEMMKKDTNPLSIAIFHQMFEEKRLSIYKRKKDECETCIGFRQGNISQNVYDEHRVKKEIARVEKAEDKVSTNNIVFTVDLQSVLLAPLNKSGSMYYKTKLTVHNWTAFNLKTGEGYCFLWNETEGDLTGNVFATLYVYFIPKYVLPNFKTDGDKKPVIFWSDGCGYQNRNAILSNAMFNCAVEHGIVIEQKVLEKGHTQMECDSMHARIEQSCRNKEINVPADYIDLCKSARKKQNGYVVEYLHHTFFKQFERVSNFKSIKPNKNYNVHDIRGLHYDGIGRKILFKVDHSKEFEALPVKRNMTFNFQPFSTLPPLFRSTLPIAQSKYKHLQELTAVIPKDNHSFYNTLQFVVEKKKNKDANDESKK